MTNSSRQIIAGGSALNAGETTPVDTLGAPSATILAIWGAAVSAGVVTFEGTDVDPPPLQPNATDRGKWVSLGTASFVAGGSSKVSMPAGDAYRYVRARITTAVVGGTVDVYVATAGYSSGGWN